MGKKPIELELRGEIRPADFLRLCHLLRTRGFHRVSTTRRTSIMFFGTVTGHRKGHREIRHVDLRCRMTNGEAEIVTKIGKDVTSRLEISIPISLDALIAFSCMFAEMGFFAKVGSKFTENFQRGPILVSLVRSPRGLAYVEIEKMTDRQHEQGDRQKLDRVSHDLGVRVWKTKKEFLAFCDRLTTQDDWEYHGSAADVKRLKTELNRSGSRRRRGGLSIEKK